MLAAAPAQSGRSLDLFVLALTLATHRDTPSATLVDHFNRTLTQARDVLRNPGSISAEISNEAVQLALEISSDPQVRDSLEHVNSFDQVTPEVARDLLKEMSVSIEA